MQKTELKEDLEKVNIATFLCQNCTSKEMSNLSRMTYACYGIECWLRKQGLKVTTKTV